MSFTGLLDETITIQTVAYSQSNISGKNETWTARYTSIPARIEELTANERLMAGREGWERTHRIYIDPAYSAVAPSDRVVDSGSVVYQLEEVKEAKAFSGVHHYELMAVRRT